MGENGAGKSTTLKMLTGMVEPSSGRATVCGFDLTTQPIEVKRRVGFVPESGAVFESLTGLEYLEMVASLYAIPADAAPCPGLPLVIMGKPAMGRRKFWESR
jgi:ABC-2 type transport system ATP-binding protein